MVADIKLLWQRLPLGAPARYAVLAAALSLLWFPIRFWALDRGDPLSEVIAGAAFSGAIWALFPWLNRLSRPRGQRPSDGPADLDPRESLARARRGALVGMAVGALYFGGLIAMSLLAGRPLYAATFAVILLLMGVAAAVSLRRASRRTARTKRA